MPLTGRVVTGNGDEHPASDDDRTLEIGDHLTPTTSAHTAGVYRVVGHGDGTVTLLRVGDADGTRVHTGEVVSVATTDGFERTTTPRRPSVAVSFAARLRNTAWSVWVFFAGLWRRPRQTALTAVPLVVAVAVEGHVPEWVVAGLVFVGGLTLAAVGGGQLDR